VTVPTTRDPMSSFLKSHAAQPRNSLILVKDSVHDVLRCAQTYRDVLQTALCYLDAVSPSEYVMGTSELTR
jgi:hypothetical protein